MEGSEQTGSESTTELHRFRTVLFSLTDVVSDIASSVRGETDIRRAAEALKFVVKQLALELPRYTREN